MFIEQKEADWATTGFVQETVVPDTFVLPQLPETLVDPEERRAFLITHYWDRFDFSDSTLTRKPAITEQALWITSTSLA